MSLEIDTIHFGDCFELLPQIEKMDLILTSPPFMDKEVPDNDYYRWLDKFINLAMSKCDRMLMFSSSQRIVDICKKFNPAHILIWNMKFSMRAFRYQPIFLFLNDKDETVWGKGHIWSNIISVTGVHKRKKVHINQDPVEVYSQLLRYFPKSEIVVDPFSGSGTTAISAIRQGRKFIGIENDFGSYITSLERIEEERNGKEN